MTLKIMHKQSAARWIVSLIVEVTREWSSSCCVGSSPRAFHRILNKWRSNIGRFHSPDSLPSAASTLAPNRRRCNSILGFRYITAKYTGGTPKGNRKQKSWKRTPENSSFDLHAWWRKKIVVESSFWNIWLYLIWRMWLKT